MRLAFSAIFVLLIIGLAICAVKARKPHKAIGRSVSLLVAALIPPVIGNLIIISSTRQALSLHGCYVYFLGMDLVMFALLRFTMDYCQISGKNRKFRFIAWALLIADALQLMGNPIFGHAFTTEMILADGAPYYRLVPFAGQTFHRLVDYGILAAVLLIFLVKMIRASRINSERYSVVLAAIIVVTAWETAYIFSRTPVDRAMVGFGVFGLLIYYLALYYRPLRLLDSMLANMASEMPEALYFFDAGGYCIWANRPGIALAEIEDDDFEQAADRLHALFGDYDREEAFRKEVVINGATRSFILEKRSVTDDRQRLAGSFLSVRDNTAEQETLQREIYKATHDSLTSLYNRAGYDLLRTSLDLKTTCLLLIDIDSFKSVNDTYGHETGDRILQKTADTIKRNFRSNDYACRIGGDEFVVFMTRASEQQRQFITSRVERINRELGQPADGLPPVSVSVGIAHGKQAKDQSELFDLADRALYETKRRGKRGLTFSGDTSGEK